MNNNVSIYPTSKSARNRPFKKKQIIKKQSRALSRMLITEYPGYSLISEPITAREKHYSLVGYMLTMDIYFLLSNQSARKVLFTCLANANEYYHIDKIALLDNTPLVILIRQYIRDFSRTTHTGS